MLVEIGNYMKIMQATWKSIEYTKKNFWERLEKFTVYCLVCAVHKVYIYIPNSNFLRKKKLILQTALFTILALQVEILWLCGDFMILWRFNDYVLNIFIVTKVFIRPLQTFKQLLIQQNWQWNPCFISNIDALCYNNQPKFIIDVW